MRSEAELRKYFSGTLLPRIADLKARHDRAWRLHRLRWKLLGFGGPILALALVPTVLTLMDKGILPRGIGMALPIPIFFFLGFVGAPILAGVLSARFTKHWAPLPKQDIMVPAVRFLAPEFEYDPAASVPRETALASGLFAMHGANLKFSGDDRFKGRIGKTQVEFAELVMTYTSTGRKRRTVTERGLLFVAEFNKRLDHRTLVLPDYTEAYQGAIKVAKVAAIGFLLAQTGPVGAVGVLKYLHDSVKSAGASAGGSRRGGGMQLVRLENTEFEQHYAVYSTDDVEARYILTPPFMERMTEFTKQYGKGARFSFRDQSLFLFIPTSEMFELDLKQDVTQFEVFAAHLGPLALVHDIVEMLNLNQRLWSK